MVQSSGNSVLEFKGLVWSRGSEVYVYCLGLRGLIINRTVGGVQSLAFEFGASQIS